MIDDATLLRRYARDRSEDAFAEFVRRHLPLVYSAAVRRLGGDAHRAEDVAQVVFCAVARDARRLAQHTVLTAWLYTATRNAVIDVIRAETRRHGREEEAQIMHATSSDLENSTDWSRLRPVLDAAMDELSGGDREAVLLRFFQGRPFAEIGTVLGLSEDAARKRVERALDKLGGVLRRHRIASTSAALATLLAGETISAAPASLAASITGAALATGGVATAGIATFMAVTKFQAGIAAAVILGGTVGLVKQHQIIAALREDTAGLKQQLATVSTDRGAGAQIQAKASAEIAKVRSDAQAEVARLSAEVATLRQSAANANRATVSRPIDPLRNEARASALLPLPDTPEIDQQKASLHRRYDAFLQARGLTPEQADRFVELQIHQGLIRQDLQASVETTGTPYVANEQGIEKLRSKLYEPVTSELKALLGSDGYQAFTEYSRTSYYRESFVGSMLPEFSSANVPLSPDQIDRLVRVVAANDHPVKTKPTDIGSHSLIDWDAVVSQASDVLTPAQLALLQTHANRRKSN